MSEDADLVRDLRLAETLAHLPPRPVPDGLVDRIVRNATQLPQQSVAVAVPGEPSIPRIGPSAIPRWLRYASGAAIAAGIAAALLSLGSGPSDMTPAAQRSPQVAQNTPTPELAPVAAKSAAPLRAATETPVQKPGTRLAAPPTPPAKASTPAVDNGAQLAQKGPVPVPSGAAPKAGPAPGPDDGEDIGPTEREFAGPPDTSPMGPPNPQGGGAPGMGISGSRIPELPGGSTTTAPAPRGGGPGGMPRF